MTLETSIRAIIRHSSADLQSANSHLSLAQAIVMGLYRIREMSEAPVRTGADFGVVYSAIVWNHCPTTSFSSVIRCQPDPVVEPFHKHYGRQSAANGMIPYLSCGGGQDDPPAGVRVGAFGWPCLIGGAIALSQSNALGVAKNCMLYYTPIAAQPEDGPTPSSLPVQLARIRDAVEACKALQRALRDAHAAASRVDVTRFSLCIYDTYPLMARANRASRGGRRLKGIVTLPGNAPGWEARRPPLFAVLAVGGQLVISNIRIPSPVGSDADPLYLYCICGTE